MAYAQHVQVGNDVAGIGKGELSIELQPVGRPGYRRRVHVASAFGRRDQNTDQAGRQSCCVRPERPGCVV